MKTLTTGALSGLGKYIHENLGGYGLTRTLPAGERADIRNNGVDVIIHCAFNSRREVDSSSIYGYLEDNVLLTRELTAIPHKKFIYISSVDVYPKNDELHSEDQILDTDTIRGLYGITKLMSEAIVKNDCKNYLILRPTALLGRYSRKNSLIKIIEDENCRLTLSGDSVFNYVLHADVLDFIKLALERDFQGIYNLASSENISLQEAAGLFKKKVIFGKYCYNVGSIDNKKASSVFPAFRGTSREILTRFARDWRK